MGESREREKWVCYCVVRALVYRYDLEQHDSDPDPPEPLLAVLRNYYFRDDTGDPLLD